MSISPVGGFNAQYYTAWTQSVSAEGRRYQDVPAEARNLVPTPTEQPDPLAPHVLEPDDELTQHLTTGDKAAIETLYGIRFEANGDIVTPVDIEPNTMVAALAAAGQIASGRAKATLDDFDVTRDSIENLVQGFEARIEQNLDPFEGGTASPQHIDVSV